MQELYRHQLSPIHAMDARVKVIFTLAFILTLSLTPFSAWPAYVLFFSLILSITLVSRLGAGYVLKRALLAVPFVLAALPLVFTGAPPLVPVSILQPWEVFYSPAGLERFISIAIRSWISLQAAIILAATTRVPDLLLALKQLGLPRLFVAIVGLMWRYLFVISEEVTRMLRARSSRSASLPSAKRSDGSIFWRGKVTGGMAGSLFLRSLERSDRVYAAMLSRGYNGEPVALDAAPLHRTDKLILAAGLVVLLILLLLGILTGG